MCAPGDSLIVECGCCSRGYATNSGTESDGDQENSDGIETSHPLPTRKGGGSTALKKRVELDVQGQPFGAMKAVLCADIKKYAKDLDPTTGWEGQPRHERKRLFKRLYTGKVCTSIFWHACVALICDVKPESDILSATKHHSGHEQQGVCLCRQA